MDERQKKLNEGFTEFGNSVPPGNQYTGVWGRIGAFFSKFFTTQGQEAYVNQKRGQVATSATPVGPSGQQLRPSQQLHGDAVAKNDVIKFKEPNSPIARHQIKYLPVLPEYETQRKYRNREFEDMDTYPEIGTAFDIFADDCTQENIDGTKWDIRTNNNLIKDEINLLLEGIHFEDFVWDIVRNTVKYGDCFIELVVDTENIKRGIQRIKILNPNYIYRVEDEFGYLDSFFQEIPLKDDWTTFGGAGDAMTRNQVIPLHREQIVHFRLHTSDPAFYPYGKSIAAVCRSIYRMLKMMEDAMLIYRLARAPERRIFYIDTGNLPASKAEMHLDNMIKKFKKNKMYSASTGNIDERWDPLAVDEDFYITINGKQSGTKIDTLKGAENLGEVDDVKYFLDKLLAALKIPKDYVVEKDQSPNRKANLAQLDVKFARTIGRIQKSVEKGIEAIVKRHLIIKGYPYDEVTKVKIRLPSPSDMAEKRRLDLDEQKARVVQAVKMLGIFPMSKLYRDYYQLNPNEIKETVEEIGDEMNDPIMSMIHQTGGVGMPMEGGMGEPGSEESVGLDDTTQNSSTTESEENTPPTQNEVVNYRSLRSNLVKNNASPEILQLITELQLSDKNMINEGLNLDK